MSKITIVTAFFDIGRGNWTPDKGLPHYLQRSTETYMERFSYLAELENDMVIYTSEDQANTIAQIRSDKSSNTKIVVVDFQENFADGREMISEIQKSPEFQAKINPSQIKNPEYWNADYVLVNYLKSHFVNHALASGLIEDELVAWLDFGYCRSKDTLNGVKEWKYNFSEDKIHVFSIKDWVDGTFVEDVIANNDVHITGPHIIASQKMWPRLFTMMEQQLNFLVNHNFIDDDQTLLLMSTLGNPNEFEIHKVSPNDWFVMFKDYNEN